MWRAITLANSKKFLCWISTHHALAHIHEHTEYTQIVILKKKNEISDKLAKQGAMKNMSETSYSNLLLSSHEIISVLECV